jgi:hypothetical protein
MRHRVLVPAALIAALVLTGARSAAAQSSSSDTPNTLTAAERAEGWQLLFDGKSPSQWRGYKSNSVPDGWKVEDGTLTKSGSTGDIITRNKFANFELDLDWKIASGGNAGIFYRGTEEYDHIYWSAPEYQLLDDAKAPDGRSRLTSAGAAYALYPSPAGILKPAGEWNSTRIIVKGAHVEHWLNGKKLLEYTLWSPDWNAKVKASKFAAYPHYGMAKTGYIGIQGDHDGALSLRNVKIRVLK